MRSLIWDEINRPDMDKLREHLGQALQASALPDVYWLELPPDLLNAEQVEHTDCGPHRLAVVLEEGEMRLELLVRSQASLRCSCTAYATKAQRDFAIRFADRVVEELQVRT